MTNFEKFKEDLMKIEGCFGFSKTKQKIGTCYCADDNVETVECEDCLFLFNELPTGCCENEKIKWLYEEYKPPVLTDNELELIKDIGRATNKRYKYVIRTESGEIRLFDCKPTILDDAFGEYCFLSKSGYFSVLDSDLFQGIKSKDGLYNIENKCFIRK